MSSRLARPSNDASPTDAALEPTARQREAAKSEASKSEDTAYVMNHTLTCLLFDVTGAPAAFSALISGRLKDNRDRAAGIAAENGTFRHWSQRFFSNAKEWWIGELVGDLGAVPVTIAVQRTFPGAISAISHTLEKPLGPFYRMSARSATDHWAVQRGILANSPEYNEHEEQVYHHEIDHLGDAAVWTGAAFTGNVVTQKLRQNWFIPVEKRLATTDIMSGKLGSALWATGTVIALRALAPAKAQNWDHETSKHLLRPAAHLMHRSAVPAPVQPVFTSATLPIEANDNALPAAPTSLSATRLNKMPTTHITEANDNTRLIAPAASVAALA